MRRLPGLSVLAICLILPGFSAAQEPRSAIEWLSSSLVNPPKFRVTPEQPPILSDLWEVIELIPISQDGPQSIGLLSPDKAGLPEDFWGNLSIEEAADYLRAQPRPGLPATTALWREILLAKMAPLQGTAEALQMARLDRLVELGTLEEAELLAGQIYPMTSTVIEKRFEIGLLVNRTEAVCQDLFDHPGLQVSAGMRVICLAREGDWNAAAVFLTSASMIGDIPRSEEEMLIAFLDPELAEVMGATSQAENPAYDYFLREAIGLPRANANPPLAYRYYDLSVNAALRARLEASEAFARAGSLPVSLLFAAYRSGTPSASGGVWERAIWVQAMDDALFDGDAERVTNLLETGVSLFSAIGLLHAIADEYARKLLAHSSLFDAEANQHAWRLSLLAGGQQGEFPTVNDDHALRTAWLVASGEIDGIEPGDDPLAIAIREGLNGNAKERSAVQEARRLIEEGRPGIAILSALALLSAGFEADPNDIKAGLAMLTETGMEETARKAAIELLLLDMADG